MLQVFKGIVQLAHNLLTFLDRFELNLEDSELIRVPAQVLI
jgi:hypothetical protein